ncbi:hypothetical protein [Streptomyces hoynatensis]|uniref:hypothetical protein n=1 Tax=Streptomyces hoynatensis TaxID=1141874 RepID=UPI0011C35FBD|nr:hypothetical protein [Streptomyces hoynatensis]
MSYLRGFVPWIVFAALSDTDWRWAAAAALAAALGLLALDRRSGVAAEALVLDLSTLGYFCLLTAASFAAPGSWLADWSGVVSMAWLALTAWGTLALGRPFTLGIAKRQTPPEVWERPEFLRANVAISAAWAAAFTFIGAALACCEATGAPASAGVTAHVVGLGAAIAFTSRHPARVRARAAAGA